MRQYATSKFRLLVLIAMMTAAVITATASFAQDAPPAGGGGGAAAAPAGGGAGAATTAKAAGGLLQLILGHVDAVTVTIVILSIIGLTLIIQGFIKNRASVFMPEPTTNQIREMIAARRFKELIDFTERDPSFVSRALNPALKRAPSFSAMKEAMETAIGEQTAEQFRRIEYLNIIGNLGPLLGLLGTVLGMIYAFQAVATSGGQADVGKLSDGIAVALAHTFMGLFLAVPCLAAFGILRTIVDRLTTRGALVAEELLLMIKPQEAKPAAAGALAAPRPAATPVPAARSKPAPAV
jgi:biopolymer transport protein ExbB